MKRKLFILLISIAFYNTTFAQSPEIKLKQEVGITCLFGWYETRYDDFNSNGYALNYDISIKTHDSFYAGLSIAYQEINEQLTSVPICMQYKFIPESKKLPYIFCKLGSSVIVENHLKEYQNPKGRLYQQFGVGYAYPLSKTKLLFSLSFTDNNIKSEGRELDYTLTMLNLGFLF